MSVFTNPAGRAPEHARAYVEAILDLLGDRDPLTVLRDTPAELERFLTGTLDEVLGKPEAPGKWAMRDVFAHLADSDLVWGWRLRLVLAEDRPPLTGYDQDAWASRLGYADSDPHDSVVRVRERRMSRAIFPPECCLCLSPGARFRRKRFCRFCRCPRRGRARPFLRCR